MRARGGLLVAIAVLSFAAACAGDGSGTGRGVLLIAIDELRADHLSTFGYERPTTPHLDRLAADGILFTRTYSVAPLLIPAHTGLLTGCYPETARRRLPDRIQLPEANRWVISEKVPHLAVEFLSAGYATAAFLDTDSLPPFGGYDAGFQVFDRDDVQNRRRRSERGGAALSVALRDWLGELPRNKNWFAYLHLRDLERTWRERDPKWDDYFSPQGFGSFVPPVSTTDQAFFSIPSSRWGGLPKNLTVYEARYDGALRRVDDVLGTLFRNLQIQGKWDNTSVCVVGSYGLQFGEAGLILSSGMLSVPDLHVPWIFRPGKGQTPRAVERGQTERSGNSSLRGKRLAHLASSIDIAPTLLDWEGLRIPKGIHGVSHVPVLEGRESEARSHAFASCGLVGGSVVFGKIWALQELNFGAESPEVLQQWFGSREPEVSLVQRRFYEHRVREHFPLIGAGSEPDTELSKELARVLATWQLNILATWAVLQNPTIFEEGEDEAVISHLRELGYLGEIR